MRYIFGDYSLDTQRYELRRDGDLIPLGPQVFNVLAYLLAHRDRVVSRDELFARLWPDQFVTDDALGRCIRAARRALEDDAAAPRCIMTTRGRGYRFIALVQEQPHRPREEGVVTMVPIQSSPLQPSAARSETHPQPVFLPTMSEERLHRAEEYRHPLALAGEYKQVTVLCGGLADALALATLDQSDMRLWEAELYRLRGELLLQQTVPQAAEAVACFEQAMAVARRQQARSWELRAALSLARLWQRQGKHIEAHQLLAEVYGWFTEGFDTADLQEAKALLEELGA